MSQKMIVFGNRVRDMRLEMVSKPHLTPNNGVVTRSLTSRLFYKIKVGVDLLKMLTYSDVCYAFSSVHALFLA
jgi:hypothetical protein